MCMISMRLSGPAGSIDAMLDELRGTHGVEAIVELGVSEVPRMSDDSSSAGLPSDTHSGTRDVEVHALNEAVSDNVRDRIEIAGRDAGVVVEWLQPM